MALAMLQTDSKVYPTKVQSSKNRDEQAVYTVVLGMASFTFTPLPHIWNIRAIWLAVLPKNITGNRNQVVAKSKT